MLLKSVMEAVANHECVDEIYLHVQTSNEDAINFYAKHAFVTKDIIRNYYKRIEPPDCYVLSKSLVSSCPPSEQEEEEDGPAAATAPAVRSL